MKHVSSNQVPKAVGPYSHAVITDHYMFISGQLPIDPSTGNLRDGVKEQTRQSLENLKAILEEAGITLGHVVKTTVFIRDMDLFPEINEVYQEYFPTNCPARSCVEVSRLPKDALVEVEAIAYMKGADA